MAAMAHRTSARELMHQSKAGMTLNITVTRTWVVRFGLWLLKRDIQFISWLTGIRIGLHERERRG
jgi:hypothetical protein